MNVKQSLDHILTDNLALVTIRPVRTRERAVTKLFIDSDRYGTPNTSPVVEAIHAGVQSLVRDAAGDDWPDFVARGGFEAIGRGDIAAVEQMLVDGGHRFEWSAAISAQERPEAYTAAAGLSGGDMDGYSFDHSDAQSGEADASGARQVGQGDNVARFPEVVEGTVRYIRSPAQVMQYMTDGVPDDTIAVIDDSGGTLTAPILEHFRGVICAGGSTRSHLGILTREYGVPCLMNAKLSDLPQGARVRFDATADPKTAADYQKNVERTATIWRLSDAEDGA